MKTVAPLGRWIAGVLEQSPDDLMDAAHEKVLKLTSQAAAYKDEVMRLQSQAEELKAAEGEGYAAHRFDRRYQPRFKLFPLYGNSPP
jgi:hypothetical protein